MPKLTTHHGAEIVDGVHRYPRTGIRVIIVGAGIAGLMAALECWRKGHEVQILERAESMSTLGDGFTITPSGLTTLDQYPRMRIAYQEHMYNSIIKAHNWAGKEFHQSEADWYGKMDPSEAKQPVSFVKSRPQFAKMMLDQAARLGIAVFWGRKATMYDEDILSGEALVRTESGEVFAGDVVVAADGAGTRSHNIVNGGIAKLEHTGYTVVRASWPTEFISPGSPAASLIPKINERPRFNVYLGKHQHLVLMCQQEWVGFAYTYKSSENTHNISKEALLEIITAKGDLDPTVLNLFRQIPSTTKIVDWKLSWRDPLPQWVSKGGRVVQLGDAAHAFLPSSGNGATQALEDSVTIAECLRLGGKAKVAWSTSAYQQLRFERVSLIQKSGITNREKLHNAYIVLEKMEAGHLPEDEMKVEMYGEWMWKHNPEKYATENYEDAVNHLRYGDDFQNTNIPAGLKYKPWTAKQVIDDSIAAKNVVVHQDNRM